ncbi:3-methyl-2-oxobutanoate hydroxymethyltransferase [Cohnella fermenti]|uniref:3-methyl-2-oxobutanoate hydroxymethyltransferase n=1 Tax=Cohnella fermenti TaxID=2565925 RepID=A0A4S4BWF6_9BACL|nr:3-methyl-2-oxobutanoate hydroxymethyltransferase [Cohnella fermenti]THF79506.1 3-methyl-2-oxobutanoate hydroxymethyltransferase [Cohnella fermenti]
MPTPKPLTIHKLREMKSNGQPIVMTTAYDYPSARLAEEAGVDIVLVGDSLGNVILNYESTIPVTLDDIVYHARAVARGAMHTFRVADMPFMTYHGSLDETLRHVRRLMQEGHAHAVKMEGGQEIERTVKRIVQAGVPVLGHIGLTPQSIHQLGGYKIQGKDPQSVRRLLDDAKALERAGVFAIVVELMTEEAAERIAREVAIPIIGIGAGRSCDGQLLVYHDLVRYSPDYRGKKFVKTYADVGSLIRDSIARYADEVRTRAFPAEEHVFHAGQDSVKALYGQS